MIDVSDVINYEKHKKYMRDRYHRIEFKIKNKIKEPPIISIKSDIVILTFEWMKEIHIIMKEFYM